MLLGIKDFDKDFNSMIGSCMPSYPDFWGDLKRGPSTFDPLNLSEILKQTERHFLDEDKESYYLELEMTGFSKDHIKLYMDGLHLVVEAENEKSKFTKKLNRKIYIGDKASQANVNAVLKDGVLRVTIPKEDERSNLIPISLS